MKLLMLGLNYAPEPVGIGPYTAGLAEALAARGHRVAVIAGKPYYPQWRLYDGHENGRAETVERGVAVTRVPHVIPADPSGGKRILHHLSFAASSYAPTMRAARAKPDLVFAVAPSLLSIAIAARAARAADAPLWAHVQDFEIEAAFATGLLDPASVVGRAARWGEGRILALADVVSSIGPQMCDRLVAKGIARERVFELRNWSDPGFDFARADARTYRREWRLGERHVALYSGNIANKQGLEIVIAAARMLAARDDIAFVICGEGPNRARLEQLAGGLPNVQFHGLQSAARMADLLSLATVHLLPQIVGAADLVLPSKLTNMLASARPVAATAAAGTGLAAEVDGCGLVTEPGDPQALADAVARLVDEPALREALGAEAGRRAAARWSRDSVIDGFERRAAELVRRRAPR
ncbi:MAG TPA: WcaI family glycosyltransferase [Croceibacterium sp.]|nr:WcaI family glycosyltransferase [Croceibacterium sp.]